ncbi:hypothetical protein EPI10_028293 [Gossypium australe]|uniref:Uncharacterized protein n=1 Tax=Gossypium australe TaxID=47621 RepID=A0A5B6UY93_9ROSI|nr:hypothetical protein EPI10_028293 [Gossypium australe]
MRSPLFNKWMMNSYRKHGKDSRSFYVDALIMGFHIASSWRHFIMVSTHTMLVVYNSANGALLSKSYNKAYEIIERIATLGIRVAGVHEVDAFTSLLAQVSYISSMLKPFTTKGFNPIAAQPPSQFDIIFCVYCKDGYSFKNCQSNSESVYYVGNQHQNGNGQGPQSNFYNPVKKGTR